MRPDPDAWLHSVRRKVVFDVNTFGWHVMQVLGGPDVPGWSYTVGLFSNYEHPEVAIFGLDMKVMHQVLNLVGRAVQGGDRFADGAETSVLLEEYGCMFRHVSPVWIPELFVFARWFHGSAAFPMLQVFWPDHARRYPWQRGFDATLAPYQPLLFASDPDAAGVRKLVSPEA